MTRDELRAGLVRLGLVVAGTVAALVAAGVVMWALRGGSLTRAISLAFAVASSLLVLAGALAGLSTGPISMERDSGVRKRRIRTKAERRERELLALGLIAAGIACFVVSIMIG